MLLKCCCQLWVKTFVIHSMLGIYIRTISLILVNAVLYMRQQLIRNRLKLFTLEMNFSLNILVLSFGSLHL